MHMQDDQILSIRSASDASGGIAYKAPKFSPQFIQGLMIALTLLAAALASEEYSWTPLQFDWFYGTCSDGIADNALIATDCPLTLSVPDYSNYMSCLCANGNFTLSMYNCFVEAQKKTQVSKKSIGDSYNAFIGYCKIYGGTPISYSLEEAKAYFEENPTVISWEEGNSTMSGPFAPDWDLLDDTLLASGLESHSQYWYAEVFGLVSLWYIFLIILLQACLHWGSYLMPSLVRGLSNNALARQFRRHVALPAIWGNARARPVRIFRWFLLCFPPRLHSFFFLGYLFLSIFGMCYHYHIILSPYWYTTKVQYISAAIAWRSGELAMYKMPLVFLFAGRNNILIWLTGWQMEIFNHWHRWIARLMTIDVIMHSIAYSIEFVAFDEYKSSFGEQYWDWGFVATVMVAFCTLNGTKTFRELCYEAFLYLHIVMAVFSIVGTYYHIKTYHGLLNLWPCVAFWGFDRAARLVRVLLSKPFATAHVIALPSETLEVTVQYSGWWKPRAGTYVFIHFLNSPLYAFQSHPFTIVDGDKAGEFKLFAKVQNGMTRQLYKKAQAAGGELTCRTLVEGPYGVEFATSMYKEVILFAGGIGITAIYSHLKHTVHKGTKGQIIHVHWAISNSDPLTWFRHELNYMAQFPNVEITIHLNDSYAAAPGSSSAENSLDKRDQTSETVSIEHVSIQKVNFIPDFDRIVNDHITNSQGSSVFFVCGPPAMSDVIRASVSRNLLHSKNYVQYYEESFTM